MPLITTGAVTLLMVGVGLAAERALLGSRLSDVTSPVYALVAGWAVTTFVAVTCALFGLKLLAPMALMGFVGLIGLLSGAPFVAIGKLTFAWFLVLPLLILATTIPPTMFDEFSHWLPNARFLVENERFPDATSPNLWSVAPGYPPALPLIGYLVEKLTPNSYELAGKVFNVLLVASFGLVLADRIRSSIGGLAAIAVGVAGATVLNPFFDPRVALTAYPDMPSGVALALCLAACWRSLDDGDPVWRFRIAGTVIVLTLLRETNVAFVIGMAGGLIFVGHRTWGTFTALVGPAVVAFALWRLYLWSAAIPPVLTPLPVAEWNWRAPITVISILFTERLRGNPLLGIAALAFTGTVFVLILRSIRRASSALRDLFLLIGTVSGIWILFLAASYVTVLPPVVALEAHSTWRYISQLGPTLTLGLFALAGSQAAAIQNRTLATKSRWSTRLFAGTVIACLVPGAFTLATWRYWKISCRYPVLTVTRTMTLSMPPAVRQSTLIQVSNPPTASWPALVVGYDLHRMPEATRQISSPETALKDGYLLDLTEFVPDRMQNASFSPKVILSHWNGAEWQPVFTRLFQPNDYACTFW